MEGGDISDNDRFTEVHVSDDESGVRDDIVAGVNEIKDEKASVGEEHVETSNTASHKFPSKRIFGRHGAYPCTVCKVASSKYKFTCCRFGYCSIECFREHAKPGACTAPTFVPTAERPVFKRRPTNPLLDLDIAEGDLVTKDVLNGLRNNKQIRDYASNPKLRRIFSKIDNSRDRNATLERQMLIDPEFRKVVDVIASSIGYKQL